MSKIIGIIKNDPITGVVYGEIEIYDTPVQIATNAQKAYIQAKELQKLRTSKTRKNNTKHK